MSAVSSTFAHTTACTRRRAPFRSRRKMCRSNQGSLAISIQVWNSVRPMHLFGHNLDHDYYFELLCEEERAAQSISRCSTAHHRLFRAGPRANRTFSLARNPIPCATSNRERIASLRAIATLAIFRPRRIARWKYLLRHSGMLRAVTWAASTSKKRNIELPCLVICPSRRRFPLESSKGTNPKISGDLLATLKSLRSPDDQHEGQRS